MNSTSKAVLTLLLSASWCLFGLTSSAESEVIGTFGPPRVSTGNLATGGTLAQQANASLLSHFPGTTFATSDTLTPGFLSNVNMLLISDAATDSLPISPLTPSEKSAMFNFVKGGGNAFLIMEPFSIFEPVAQSVLDAFGMTVVDDGVSGVLSNVPTGPVHPIFQGPFGPVTSYLSLGAGAISNLGPYATATAMESNTHQVSMAVIEANAIAPGSGRVVIYTDGNTFIDDADGGGFSLDETIFLNTVAYLIPEPSSLVLAAAALVGLGISVGRSRRNRRSKRSAA